MITRNHILKLLSGPQMGAEIALGEGTYVLGTGAECDLILQDRGLGDQQLTVHIEGEQVSFMGGPGVALTGEPTEVGEQPWPSFAILTYGTTHLAVGPAHEPWPVLSPLSLPTPSPTPEPEAETTAQAEPEPAPKPRRKGQLVALILLLLTPVVIHLLPASAPPVTPEVETESLPDLLKRLQLTDVQPVTSHWGTILRGYVPNGASLGTLRTALQDHHADVALEVFRGDELLSNSQRVLDGHRLELKAAHLGSGILALEGFVLDTSKFEHAKTALTSDVPGLKDIQSSVLTSADVVADVEKLRETCSPNQNLHYRLKGTQLRIWGRLDADQRTCLTPALTELETRFGRWITITHDLRDSKRPTVVRPKSPAQQSPPDLDLVAVNVGEVRYLTLADGNRYFEGGRLPGGWVIRNITHEHIVLRLGDRDLHYHLGAQP